MKLYYDLHEESPYVLRFVINWKKIKGYYPAPKLSLGEAIELYVAVTNGPHHDEILHGAFNKVLDGEEFRIGFDGDELIDIVVYKVVELIKRRLAKTFNEPLDR